MEDLNFFQTLTPKMIDACGFKNNEYDFFYTYENEHHFLDIVRGRNSIVLSDKFDIWKIYKDGLSLTKMIQVAYPDLLKGPSGVACEKADIGFCIVWTCKSTTQTGYILPVVDETLPSGRTVRFDYNFPAGSIDGKLLLELVIYIKNNALEVASDEDNLMNDTGVIVGYLESLVLDFKNKYMEFPIEECNSANEPLWWLFIKDWEDPKTVDMFTKESLCLYLNSYYAKACPTASSKGENGILNLDMMIDILAQTYFLLFKKLEECGDLHATRNNIGLVDGTVSYVLYQFIEDCEDLNWDRPEYLLKSLQTNFRRMLHREDS